MAAWEKIYKNKNAIQEQFKHMSRNTKQQLENNLNHIAVFGNTEPSLTKEEADKEIINCKQYSSFDTFLFEGNGEDIVITTVKNRLKQIIQIRNPSIKDGMYYMVITINGNNLFRSHKDSHRLLLVILENDTITNVFNFKVNVDGKDISITSDKIEKLLETIHKEKRKINVFNIIRDEIKEFTHYTNVKDLMKQIQHTSYSVAPLTPQEASTGAGRKLLPIGTKRRGNYRMARSKKCIRHHKNLTCRRRKH